MAVTSLFSSYSLRYSLIMLDGATTLVEKFFLEGGNRLLMEFPFGEIRPLMLSLICWCTFLSSYPPLTFVGVVRWRFTDLFGGSSIPSSFTSSGDCVLSLLGDSTPSTLLYFFVFDAWSDSEFKSPMLNLLSRVFTLFLLRLLPSSLALFGILKLTSEPIASLSSSISGIISFDALSLSYELRPLFIWGVVAPLRPPWRLWYDMCECELITSL